MNDGQRLDWLDEDQERVEDLFGEMVRSNGESVREILDGMISRDVLQRSCNENDKAPSNEAEGAINRGIQDVK